VKKILVFALVALALMAFSSPWAYAQGKTATVQLKAMNGSNESGTATITETGSNQIQVDVNLSNGTSEPQPAHIHKGTCANLNPNPQYPLTNVVDGKSTTTVDATNLTSLTSESYAINVHKSAADVATYVSCGDITADLISGGATQGGSLPQTGGGDQASILLGLALLAAALVIGGTKLGRAKA
jgi:LPXTG-motif cell wall-anchored protein